MCHCEAPKGPWRPEREARGSALGVQSREGSCSSYKLSLKWCAPIASVAALTAQPLAALPPYGCGVPFTGSERHAGWQHVPYFFCGARPPDLSLRGGRRPTWRPEREARGSALGVQSRSTRSECGKAIGEIAAAFPRLPRRFAPRNDKPGSLEPPNRCCDACSCIIPLRRGRAHSPQSGARRP